MSARTPPSYDPQAIEARRQAAWRARDAFATPPIDGARPRRYIKPSAPFTSGNVHIGHVRSYSIGDAYARFWRARGEDVLFAFGFDAFGLPAELGAIAGGESPGDWVARCAEHMTGQLQRLGYSLDWDRAFLSSDALMYRWSQWLFLVLLDAGLVYRGAGAVDWCDHCQTTLATIQVENGLCWRCHNPVRLIQRPQWYLRVSAHLQENDRRLRDLADSGVWDEVALSSQRFVLGRVDGIELDLGASDGGALTAFTPHGDAIALARFVLISPKHPDIDLWATDPAVRERLEDLRSGGLERGDRDAEAIPLIDTGRTLPSPAGEEPLPVLISPVVDGRFGATAVLGIPARDHSDALIARRLWPDVDDGAAEASADSERIPADLPPPPGARPAVRYRANDFSISRQRSWGTPIPVVYCASDCGAVPVPAEQLPVLLPLDLKPTGAGNPLAEREDFVQTACPRCGGPGRRETDTLDCHFDALWLWVPACVPPQERERPLQEIFALDDLRAWLPCERVVAGSDSGNFVFDQRIVTKALRDIGPLAFLADGEPFAGCLFHEMVIRDGRKMSKHLGNVVDPDELVGTYGADTVRLATLYAARPQRSLNWSDSAILRCHRFLTQVWDFSHAQLAAEAAAASEPAQTDGFAPGNGRAPVDAHAGAGAEQGSTDAHAPMRDTTEHLRSRLDKWCDTAVQKTTEEMTALEMHSAVRNVMRLFDRIKDFEKRVLARTGALGAADRDALLGALRVLAQLLAPLAPHLAEELWIAFGNDGDTQMPWPGVSSRVPA
ncbi:MAG TPA: class I tRNA ligase family protein [Solirubrobacteraceae bacterium]|nr:class I tRNA ligase family protein [Solirubrobacteraceae bacterium]